jgi:hypothetical protein
MAGQQIDPALDPLDLRNDRLEWGGDTADVRSVGLLRPLLKHTLTKVERAGLVAPADWPIHLQTYVDRSSIVL